MPDSVYHAFYTALRTFTRAWGHTPDKICVSMDVMEVLMCTPALRVYALEDATLWSIPIQPRNDLEPGTVVFCNRGTR